MDRKRRNAWRLFLIGMAPQVLTYMMMLLPHYEYGGGYGAAFIVFILFPIGLMLVGITFVILNVCGVIQLPSNTIPMK